MLSKQERLETLNFINSIQNENGAFGDSTIENFSPQTTLSGIKALKYLGKTAKYPDNILKYILGLYNSEIGAFVNPLSNEPNVFLSAAGLLILYNINAYSEFNKISENTLKFMSKNAKIREEHFMTIGVVDECKLQIKPTQAINFFKNMEINGKFGESVLNNAIASSALLRIGEKISDKQKVIDLMLNGQTKMGGFTDNEKTPDLWTTYCVMRSLDLAEVVPNSVSLAEWIKSKYQEGGGFGIDESKSLNYTYQALSCLDWAIKPIFQGANENKIDLVDKWINLGGNINVCNLEGWTPLLTASARGSAEVVEYLLTDDVKANPNIKFEDADASPLFLAGQSGDLNTVKFLLSSNPEQLFDISLVNGHNVLLQTAFYGSGKHYEIAEWILSNFKSILNISNESEYQKRLLELMRMTNVRGYNCSTMTELWGNRKLNSLFSKFDKSTESDRASYLEVLLAKLSNNNSTDSVDSTKQELTDKFIKLITNGIDKFKDSDIHYEQTKSEIFKELIEIINNSNFDINKLGSPLYETPIIIAVTGVDSNNLMADFRKDLVIFLLDNGADPDIEEKHPMAVDAIIRSAVLNHFEILQVISDYMPPLAFADALNFKPTINGQTALQDTVHRALTSEGENLQTHLNQIKWSISKGARYNIEDHTGTSPEKLARKALNDEIYKENAKSVLIALGIE